MDLREFLSVVWRRRILVVLVVVLSGALGGAFAASRGPTYESTATIAITPDIGKTGIVPADSISALLGTLAETVQSDVVLSQAETILGQPLQGDVTATTESGTGILRISVKADSATGAHDSAAAVARAFLDRLKAGQSANFLTAEIVGPATLPASPVQPRPPLIIATSLVVGLGVAILLALAIDRFRRRVETPSDLAEVSQLQLLAQIPRNRAMMRSIPPVVWDEPRWVDLQEAYRSLRTNLQFSLDGSSAAIQIASASQAQGKSTVTANLGVAFASMGVRTAIVDADLRRPTQHEIFEVPNRRGVWEGEIPDDPMRFWGTRFRGLAVLPAGPELADPTAVLQIRFPQLIERLRRSFSLILVDTPPTLPVSDARITAGWMDGVVVVLAAGQERPGSIKHAIDQLMLADAKLKGFVINASPTAVAGGYYYQRTRQVAVEDAEPAPVPGERIPADAQ